MHVLRKLKLIFQDVRILKSTYDSSGYLEISSSVDMYGEVYRLNWCVEALILVGNSFGSAISAGAVTLEPHLADGVVLTGSESQCLTYGTI